MTDSTTPMGDTDPTAPMPAPTVTSPPTPTTARIPTASSKQPWYGSHEGLVALWFVGGALAIMLAFGLGWSARGAVFAMHGGFRGPIMERQFDGGPRGRMMPGVPQPGQGFDNGWGGRGGNAPQSDGDGYGYGPQGGFPGRGCPQGGNDW